MFTELGIIGGLGAVALLLSKNKPKEKKGVLLSEVSESEAYLKLEAYLIEVEGMTYKPYHDSAGYLTTGIGHKILPHEMAYLDRQLTMGEVRELLKQDLDEKVFPYLEGLPIETLGQFVALSSFCLNVGSSAFRGSTLRQKFASKDKTAKDEFMRWVFVTDKKSGQKVIDKGLENRREKDLAMFLS